MPAGRDTRSADVAAPGRRDARRPAETRKAPHYACARAPADPAFAGSARGIWAAPARPPGRTATDIRPRFRMLAGGALRRLRAAIPRRAGGRPAPDPAAALAWARSTYCVRHMPTPCRPGPPAPRDVESVMAHNLEDLIAFWRAGPPEAIRRPFGTNPATRAGAPPPGASGRETAPGEFRNGRAAGKAGRDDPDGRGRRRPAAETAAGLAATDACAHSNSERISSMDAGTSDIGGTAGDISDSAGSPVAVI